MRLGPLLIYGKTGTSPAPKGEAGTSAASTGETEISPASMGMGHPQNLQVMLQSCCVRALRVHMGSRCLSARSYRSESRVGSERSDLPPVGARLMSVRRFCFLSRSVSLIARSLAHSDSTPVDGAACD